MKEFRKPDGSSRGSTVDKERLRRKPRGVLDLWTNTGTSAGGEGGGHDET